VTEVIEPMLVNTLILMVPIIVLAIGSRHRRWHLAGLAPWRPGGRAGRRARADPARSQCSGPASFSSRCSPTSCSGSDRRHSRLVFLPETWYQQLPYYDLVLHPVLPVATGVLASMADPLMIMRTSLIEVRDEEFMVLA
jgi:hypothetical protein